MSRRVGLNDAGTSSETWIKAIETNGSGGRKKIKKSREIHGGDRPNRRGVRKKKRKEPGPGETTFTSHDERKGG